MASGYIVPQFLTLTHGDITEALFSPSNKPPNFVFLRLAVHHLLGSLSALLNVVSSKTVAGYFLGNLCRTGDNPSKHNPRPYVYPDRKA
jgi:hypothetical protein